MLFMTYPKTERNVAICVSDFAPIARRVTLSNQPMDKVLDEILETDNPPYHVFDLKSEDWKDWVKTLKVGYVPVFVLLAEKLHSTGWGQKVCAGCDEVLSEEAFHRNGRRLESRCRACRSVEKRETRAARRERKPIRPKQTPIPSKMPNMTPVSMEDFAKSFLDATEDEET